MVPFSGGAGIRVRSKSSNANHFAVWLAGDEDGSFRRRHWDGFYVILPLPISDVFGLSRRRSGQLIGPMWISQCELNLFVRPSPKTRRRNNSTRHGYEMANWEVAECLRKARLYCDNDTNMSEEHFLVRSSCFCGKGKFASTFPWQIQYSPYDKQLTRRMRCKWC